MEDNNEVPRIAHGAYSSSTLSLALSAFKSLRGRYPNAGEPIPETAAPWRDYTYRVSNSPPADFSPSLLKVAGGASLDVDIINDYLEILRQDSEFADIFPVRTLGEGANIGAKEGLQRPAIIPYSDDTTWAFAVAYHDAIHWYDSRSRDIPVMSASGARKVVANWTGPKSEDVDSGVLMLLGIRCIQKGSPHRSQSVAEGMLPSFRSRLFVELLCQKLNPDEHDFEQLLVQEQNSHSLFFDDATHGMDVELRQPTIEPITPADSSIPDLAAGVPDLTPNRELPSRIVASKTSHRAVTTSNVVQQRQLIPDSRRCILEHLSEAVLAYRSPWLSSYANLAVLWHSVKRGTLGSVFHERYHAVLFYDQMKQLHDDGAIERAMKYQVDPQCITKMRSAQSQCKFWYDLCNTLDGWEGKYALLLTLPGSPSIRGLRCAEKQRIIDEIRFRLARHSDPLQHWLRQAEDICDAIVKQKLPAENLMIDVYHLKTHETIGDNEFEAYTSLNPRVRLPLPRVANGC
ncbi:hypothetical protein Purlil1_12801 [Purpureocillium lilacinum]|uniref:Uncharacterized protein n=1 Tax=Purpureocillium lilacinum TaxID=33203 RepID=A0ABR0BFW0_PURLI|nr:hypothetical protein Purlil1_12801 [Purpureocillium lilacinum]